VDGHAHLPPRLIPGIRLNRPQRGSHASDGTHRPGDVLQPTEWIICTHGPTYAYCFSRHSYSAGLGQTLIAVRSLFTFREQVPLHCGSEPSEESRRRRAWPSTALPGAINLGLARVPVHRQR
jgi:hypothetical protein